MNWLDLFDDEAETDRQRAREFARTMLSEPCDDDCESTTYIMNIIPDESLKQSIESDRQIDIMIQKALLSGA